MARLFSLCQTVKHFKEDKLILYRLADKEGDEWIEYRPFEMDSPEAKIVRNPYSKNENYQMNELRVWDWDPDVREWAKKTNFMFYELAMTPELMLDSEQSIITRLKSGFQLPEYCSYRFLIKLEETEDWYKVLFLDSAKYKVVHGIAKLLDNIHNLDGYYLHRHDFFNTDGVTAYTADGEPLPSRYFYRYSTLPESPDFTLSVVTFQDQITMFLNKQLKLKGFSKKEVRTYKEFFVEALDQSDEIHQFFSENGFLDEALEQNIKTLRDQLEGVLSDNNMYDLFCERMVEALPELRSRYEDQVRTKWLTEHEETCSRLKKELDSLLERKVLISKELEDQAERVKDLHAEEQLLKDQMNALTTVYEGLQASTALKIKGIKDNLTDFFADAVLYQRLLGMESSCTQAHSTKYHVLRDTFTQNGSLEKIHDFEDLIFLLKGNLEIAGVERNALDSLAQYITACLVQKTPLLIAGCSLRSIADAISMSVCGKFADIIAGLSTQSEAQDLHQTFQSCSSDAVLVEEAVGCVPESIYMQLIKNASGKILLFGMDFPEQLNFIPKNLLNYVQLLYMDGIGRRKKQQEFQGAILTSNTLKRQIEAKELRLYKVMADKTVRAMGMSRSYHDHRTEALGLMGICRGENALYAWYAYEVIPFLCYTGSNSAAIELIQDAQFNSQQAEYFKAIIRNDEDEL